jgi:hypothetical protein
MPKKVSLSPVVTLIDLYNNANHEEAESARAELQMLEANFRTKLEQLSRRRMNDPIVDVEHFCTISTPAIDALIQSNRMAPRFEEMKIPFPPFNPLFPPSHGHARAMPPFPFQAMPQHAHGGLYEKKDRKEGGLQVPAFPAFFLQRNSSDMPPAFFLQRNSSNMPQGLFPFDLIMPPYLSYPPTQSDVLERKEDSSDLLHDSAITAIVPPTHLLQRSPCLTSQHQPGINVMDVQGQEKRVDTAIVDEEDLLGKNKRKRSESDHNEAVTLWDFISHVKKTVSQDDSVGSFEGVPKTHHSPQQTLREHY